MDDADGLRTNAWEDILALIADPPLKGAALRVAAVIFGLPTLLDSVRRETRPPVGPLVRLQRRLFRVCHLVPLTVEEVAACIRHRLAAAGGREDLFTSAALACVHELSEGNPALVNQLCDNALVEAFSEDRPCVDMPQVLAAVRSITGQVEQQDPPVTVEPLEDCSATGWPIHEESLLLARCRSIAGPRTAASSLRGDPLRERLHNLQARLSEALSRVRGARLPT